MASRSRKSVTLTKAQARRIWLRAQRLDEPEPFGAGPDAVRAAVAHLGYVQIDTINVIERCHHHILFNRIPAYRRADLRQAQSVDKSVFEYWTHALAYVPSADLRFFLAEMKRQREAPSRWFASVDEADLRKILSRIRREGALSIRDIDDDVLVDKTHPWASRKPSKRALQMAFHAGLLTISARAGMVKTYELIARHFGWERRPKPASERQRLDYLMDRALRSQGLVSLDSACHLDAPTKPVLAELIEARVRRRQLVPVAVEGVSKTAHWARPEDLAAEDSSAGEGAREGGGCEAAGGLAHILSPFDPLVIQRKRFALFFGHDHRFEAYVPKEKRVYGYFALPVIVGDRLVALIDLKTDRARRKLLIQQWSWMGGEPDGATRAAIDAELHRFETFQLAAETTDQTAEAGADRNER